VASSAAILDSEKPLTRSQDGQVRLLAEIAQRIQQKNNDRSGETPVPVHYCIAEVEKIETGIFQVSVLVSGDMGVVVFNKNFDVSLVDMNFTRKEDDQKYSVSPFFSRITLFFHLFLAIATCNADGASS